MQECRPLCVLSWCAVLWTRIWLVRSLWWLPVMTKVRCRVCAQAQDSVEYLSILLPTLAYSTAYFFDFKYLTMVSASDTSKGSGPWFWVTQPPSTKSFSIFMLLNTAL